MVGQFAMVEIEAQCANACDQSQLIQISINSRTELDS